MNERNALIERLKGEERRALLDANALYEKGKPNVIERHLAGVLREAIAALSAEPSPDAAQRPAQTGCPHSTPVEGCEWCDVATAAFPELAQSPAKGGAGEVVVPANQIKALATAPHEYFDSGWQCTAFRCRQCGFRWMPDNTAGQRREEEHAENCAYVIARNALDRKHRAQPSELINPVPNPRYDDVYHDGVAAMSEPTGAAKDEGREVELALFEAWLRAVCFQAPPDHARDLALAAWLHVVTRAQPTSPRA